MVIFAIAILGQTSSAEYYHEGIIEATDTWSDDDWTGEPYSMTYSTDGSMIMLVGYGGPNEVRILDRDMSLVGKWEPTEPNLSVEGASWSYSDERIVVWGSNGTGADDALLLLSVPGFEPWVYLNLSVNNTLVDITTAQILAYDEVIVLGGRDAGGVSRLRIFDIDPSHLISDIVWKENAEIVATKSDGIVLYILDDKGFISTIDGAFWTLEERWEVSSVPPSADCIGHFANEDRIAIVGYEDGKVRLIGGYPLGPFASADTGNGPVLGVASLTWGPRFYAVAVPDGTDGSRISGWLHNETLGDKEWSNVIQTPARVLSMSTDPQISGQFLTAFDDGTIGAYRTTLILNMPPIINITAPTPNIEWKGVITVRGEVEDEGNSVEWVRYSVDGKEWLDAKGTTEFAFDVDADAYMPATYTVFVKAFDGVHESEARMDFWIYESPDDEGAGFWVWFTVCTSIVVVVLIVVYFVLTDKRRVKDKASKREGEESKEGSGD